MTAETITFDEVGRLLGLASARDQRTVGDADVLAWHDDLNTAGIDFAGARDAITHFYAVHNPALEPSKRWRITTVDVIDIVRRTRRERVKNFVYEPPAGDHDPAYLARYRGQLNAVASGQAAVPHGAIALEGGPAKAVARALAGVGRPVPEDGEETVDEAPTIRRPGPLGRPCSKCSAPVGRPCRTPAGKARPPHPVRRGEGADPQAQAAEEQRRREASRQYLARHGGAA